MNDENSGLAWTEVKALLNNLPGPDEDAISAFRARNGDLPKDVGSLGRVEELGEWLAAWQGRYPAAISRPMVYVFAATHGLAQQNPSPSASDSMARMMANYSSGGAAINQLCVDAGAGLQLFELALEMPTGDITCEPAMTEADCISALAFGMEAVGDGVDLLCLGEMGIGNITVAAAVCCALFGGEPEDWTGGPSSEADAVKRALALHKPAMNDPVAILTLIGGREFAAITGAIIAARTRRIPVLLDGFVVGAAAAILHAIKPGVLDHCMAAHLSGDHGHGRLLDILGKRPILDLGIKSGEANGAALAIPIVRAAAAVHSGMAAVAEAIGAEAVDVETGEV